MTTSNRRLCESVLALTVLAGVLAACSSSPTPSQTHTNGGAAGNPPSAGAVTESNPPGDIPDNQVFVPYRVANAYSIRVPEGWARSGGGKSVTFTSNYNRITLTTTHPAKAPSPVSVRTNEVPAIKAANQKVGNVGVTTAARPAGTATLITYRADSPPNPVTGKVAVEDVQRYDFYKNGTEVAVTLAAPAGSDNVDPWRIITTSFRWH